MFLVGMARIELAFATPITDAYLEDRTGYMLIFI
jgi:hypothetical protein